MGAVLLVALAIHHADGPTGLPPVFRSAHGIPVDSAAWRGRWVVLNYWAAWCHPCAEEMPELNRLAAGGAGRLLVFGVNADGRQGAELLSDMALLGVAFPVLAEDPGPSLGLPAIRVMPTTYLLDPAGRLRRTLLGPQSEARLRAEMGLPPPAVPERLE